MSLTLEVSLMILMVMFMRFEGFAFFLRSSMGFFDLLLESILNFLQFLVHFLLDLGSCLFKLLDELLLLLKHLIKDLLFQELSLLFSHWLDGGIGAAL